MPSDTPNRGSSAFDFSNPTRPRRFYVICMTGRCGSSWLAGLLWSTGVCGAPMEYFNFNDVMWRQAKRWGVTDLTSYVTELMRRRTGPNGMFSMKCSYPHFHFLRDLSWPVPPIPADALRVRRPMRSDRAGRFFHNRTADQTGRFQAHHAVGSSPVYSTEAIDRNLRWVEAQRKSWERYFATHSVKPHRILYEDLCQQTDQTVRGVLAFLGVDRDPVPDFRAPPPMERLSDPLKAEWIARYRSERGLG